MSAVVRILDRLERVKPTGPGRWAASCPAHNDRSPSLSIRETDDGKVLLHDFGGCPVGDVLTAIGLTVSDLFDEPLATKAGSVRSRIPAGEIIQALDHEILVALLILSDIVRERKISPDQFNRLCECAARIGAARDMVNPAKVKHHA